MAHRSKLHYIKKKKEKNKTKKINKLKKGISNFLCNCKKMRPPRNLVQLSILKGRPGILNIDTQFNFLKTKCFKCFIKCILRILNPTKALWRDFMLYWLNLIFNPNQGLALFRQTQIFRSTRHKNLRKLNSDSPSIYIDILN